MGTKICVIACAALLVAGCAALPSASTAVPVALFDDRAFGPAAHVPTRDEIFAMSDEMRGFLQRWIAPSSRRIGPQAALAAALYNGRQLQLTYDSDYTRTAAQAFDARAGNCVSLVIMTAAFAHELGVQVSYNSVVNVDTWSQQGDLFMHTRHVNLTLGRRTVLDEPRGPRSLTIDFLPAEQLTGLRTREIAEATLVAMFLNNRAVEALATGRIAAAYWHARHAIESDPGFAPAANTLGLAYLRSGQAALAEAAFQRTLVLDPTDPAAPGNLAGALAAQGRDAEAAVLRKRLPRLEPEPPPAGPG